LLRQRVLDQIDPAFSVFIASRGRAPPSPPSSIIGQAGKTPVCRQHHDLNT